MNKGFSLVELSIVLVILGLLTGGILSGQSLIRAAELRAASTENARYNAAVHSFRDRYLALPGDMRNAVKFWTAQTGAATDGVDSTCAALTTAATGTETCNGNGDGIIGTQATCTNIHERFRFWQHLANAGLIEGKYSGVQVAPANCNYVIIGTNVPQSRLANAGWGIIGTPTHHTLQLGAQVTNNVNGGVIMRPEELWNIDTKLDDGMPATGIVVSNVIASTPCRDTDLPTAVYNLQNTGMVCTANFRMKF